MRIVCQQTILMKYHALFVIVEKASKFEIVVCCKLKVALYGLIGFCQWMLVELYCFWLVCLSVIFCEHSYLVILPDFCQTSYTDLEMIWHKDCANKFDLLKG